MERIDCSRAEPYWKDARPFPREVTHPLYYTQEEIDRAGHRIETHDWARRFRDSRIRWLDRLDVLNAGDAALTQDISEQVSFPLPRCPVDRRPRSWRTNFWEWSADDPEHVRCKICGSVFPGPEHEPVGAVEVTGPAGGKVTYRYWEDEEGLRYFFENMVLYYRQQQVTRLAQPLALAYVLTGEEAYAHKAAVILDRVSQVYPNYPVHGLGKTYNTADRRGFYENQFFRDPPFPFVSARLGNFHASPFSDAAQTFGLAQAYDLIVSSGEVDRLSEAQGVDVRQRIERDLIYEAARHTLEVPYRPGNYDGSKIRGLALFGRVLGEPDLVAEGYRLYKRLIDNAFHYDGYWHEDTLNYFSMIVGTILRFPDVLGGEGGVDVIGEMPYLPRIYTAPLSLFMPDGQGLMANDKWAALTLPGPKRTIRAMGRFVEAADELQGRSRIPVADVEYALFRRTSEADRKVSDEDLLALVPESTLLPGAGNAILGVGRTRDAVRATFSFGPWGGHHHFDSLALGLHAFSEELLSDIGYTHTKYRRWATTVASHNTVVVDGEEQTTAPGRLLAYRPTADGRAGFVSAEAPEAFSRTAQYRRSLVMIPTGPETGYVVDLFEVSGGEVHDYLLHGSADIDQELHTELPLAMVDGEMGDDGEGRVPYAYLKNTQAVDVKGDVLVQFVGKGTATDVRFLDADGARLLVSDGPSIRRAQEDDGKLDDYWMKAVCLRREATESRFVSVVEAHRGGARIQGAEVLHQGQDGVLLRVEESGRVRYIGISPDGRGLSATLPEGRSFQLTGKFGVATEVDGEVALDLFDGTRLQVGRALVERAGAYTGRVTGLTGDITGEPARSELHTDARLPEGDLLKGKVVYVTHPSGLETTYLVDEVVRDGGETRILLADMPRFQWGQAEVASGETGRFESTVEQQKAQAFAGARLRIGEQVFTIKRMEGLTTFVTEGEFDFQDVVGEAFEVFSSARGDTFRIAV